MLRHASVLVSFKAEKRNGSFLYITKEMLFARLVVTTRMLFVVNAGMQNARLEGRALGVKLKSFFPVRRE